MIGSLPFTRKWSLASLLLKQKHTHTQSYKNTPFYSKTPWPPGCLPGASWVPPGCLLLHKKTRLLVKQEDMFSFSARRHVFSLSKNTCCLCQQQDTSPGCTRRHVFLLNKMTCILAEQEDMSFCWKRRHACSTIIHFFRCTRRHVFLVDEKTCLLFEHGDMSSC